jgi:hypothetical protein
MSRHQRMTAKIVAMTEIEADVLRLRKAGLTFEQIAAHSRGKIKTKSAAWKACERALVKLIQEPAEDLRKIELARLDEVMVSIWPLCMAKDLSAIDRFLKIQERRSRLLGLDIPVKQEHELTGPGGVPLQLAPAVVVYLPANGRDDEKAGDNGNGNGNGRAIAEALAKGGDNGSRLPS